MFKFLEERKIKKQEEIERYRNKHEYSIKEATMKVVFSPCAINGFKNCDQSCVHFKPGSVEYLGYTWVDEEPRFWVEMPKCKLWR